MDSCVYKFTADNNQLKEAKNLNLNPIEFNKWYKPKVELTKEPPPGDPPIFYLNVFNVYIKNSGGSLIIL